MIDEIKDSPDFASPPPPTLRSQFGSKSDNPPLALKRSGLNLHQAALVPRTEDALRKRIDFLEAQNRSLIESNEQLLHTCAAVRDVLWLLDVIRDQIVYVSPSYETEWGFSAATLYANRESWLDAIHPEDRANLRHPLQGSLSILPFQQEYRIVLNDGSIRWISDYSTPIRDESGEIWRVAGTASDITDHKAEFEALQQSEASLRLLADNLPRGTMYQWVRPASGPAYFKYISAGSEALFGIPPSRILEDEGAIGKIIHPEDLPRVVQMAEESLKALSIFNMEARVITASGELKWIHWRSSQRVLENGDIISNCIATDVTGRKHAEDALRRANRALLVLKECDEVLVRAASKPELLDQICRILVETGKLSLAWVGLAEQNELKNVRIVAAAGQHSDYARKIRLSWADEPNGRGIVGVAIRSHEVAICQDISSAPDFEPWRAAALKHGFASAVALPLVSNNICLGVICIYSDQVNGFNDEEVALLKQLAGDLTYGINALRTRSAREQLQKELLTISEREKQVIAQELHDGLCQHLAGTALMGSLLHRRLSARGDCEAPYASTICELLNTAVHEARNLSHGLHPVEDAPDGLMEALTRFAETVTKLFHIRCSFRCLEPVLLDDTVAATHLFRITQEAVNNALKHGQASRLVILLHHSTQGISLSVRDNGCGIPKASSGSRQGMGLKIMNHRAHAIGATLCVCRATSRGGTVVQCVLPKKEVRKASENTAAKRRPSAVD